MKLIHIKSMYSKVGNRRGLVIEKDDYDGKIDNVSLLVSATIGGVEYWARTFCDVYSWNPWYKRVSFCIRCGRYNKEVSA